MSRRTAISAENTGQAGFCKIVVTFVGRITMGKRVFSFASLIFVLASLLVSTSGVVSAAESAKTVSFA